MPNLTTNFSFNKPSVNDPIDEDLWGGQLNTNWDSVDTILDALTPIGARIGYTGTTAPNSRWLLAYGQAISRTTYSAFFALVSTAYGSGDGSTTFNMPDYRGRNPVGLDNLGGSSANRITSPQADSLNNTGFGSETDAGTNGSTGGHALSESELPSHTHSVKIKSGNADSASLSTSLAFGQSGGSGTNLGSTNTPDLSNSGLLNNTGSGASHSHSGSTWTGTTGSNAQPSIAEAAIVRVL
jgi:microcystin-dependent protein